MNPLASRNETIDDVELVLDQLQSVVIGKTLQSRLALACLLAGGHLLLEDLPGVGKTTMAQALAATLGLDWNRVQFTSDLLPSDITGVSVFDPATNRFRFHEGPIFASLLLADEINRAPPKTQSALLQAMEEGNLTIDGELHDLPQPFFVIATQNPADQLGVYPLPESQLDRFLATIELGYPNAQAERELLSGEDRRGLIDRLQPRVSAERVLFWQARARQTFVSEALLDYVQNLLHASRSMAAQGDCAAGLSPRAGLNLLAMSRAWALLQQHDAVLPDDVQSVFPYVAAHRLAGSLRHGRPLASQILERVDAG